MKILYSVFCSILTGKSIGSNYSGKKTIETHFIKKFVSHKNSGMIERGREWERGIKRDIK
jgi:hypothetical protein